MTVQSPSQRYSRTAILFTLCLAIAGCGGISKAKYDQIKGGMSLEEVEAILGKGSPSTIRAELAKVEVLNLPERSEAEKAADQQRELKAIWMQWGGGKQYILVFFLKGKAIMKQQEGL